MIMFWTGIFGRNVVAKSFRPVCLARGKGSTREWFRGTRDYRRMNTCAPGDRARVASRVRDVGIAVHRGYRDDPQRFERARECERDRIVDSGIRVYEESRWHLVRARYRLVGARASWASR